MDKSKADLGHFSQNFLSGWHYSIFLVILFIPYLAGAKSKTSYSLYPGISKPQSNCAHEVLNMVYNGYHLSVEKPLRLMQEMEERENLPPLSYLISVASRSVLVLNGDYPGQKQKDSLFEIIEDASEKGIDLCKAGIKKNKDLSTTYHLIMGGISGFNAILLIQKSPTKALSDGVKALKHVEQALDENPTLKDANMGTGLFHCTAANAPTFVRATLKLFQRKANMKLGLNALRQSAYQGQYTSVQSQLFLVQFLSPYEIEATREKADILQGLEKKFARNAYFCFLRNQDAIAFKPASFFSGAKAKALRGRLSRFQNYNYTTRLYAELVKWQYTLLDSLPAKTLKPNLSIALGNLSYYPYFIKSLQALMNRRPYAYTLNPNTSLDILANNLMDTTLLMLDKSELPSNRKTQLIWQTKDAFKQTFYFNQAKASIAKKLVKPKIILKTPSEAVTPSKSDSVPILSDSIFQQNANESKTDTVEILPEEPQVLWPQDSIALSDSLADADEPDSDTSASIGADSSKTNINVPQQQDSVITIRKSTRSVKKAKTKSRKPNI